ncbi:LOW QUALITY PROTEIN: trimethylguanosine synthase-like [Drosophila nasuta]|uniref:LOW QUALITY PROTEIN: trimethylguanosine synthase-like n=1 Tax=Drosophila nasuta TaxID=42062 RepID=UPI00295EAF63|nr:LOW QUALITY PROTEIN: trimethylguanosine synthase-like [Drosophila nasuta]
MPKTDQVLHTLQSRGITKKKDQPKSNIPKYMENNPKMMRFWYKRYKLFSRYDQGIELDAVSWYSVTPEGVAEEIAQRLACDIVVDAFCGCGGNAIQFAKTCRRVIAIDIDANKLEMAKHNAAIYGVADKIEFIHADFLQFASSTRLRADAVFLSPPWGGTNYSREEYDIEKHLLPVGATKMMQYARRISENVGIYLPRSSIIKQVVALAKEKQHREVDMNFLGSSWVAITAYFWDFKF